MSGFIITALVILVFIVVYQLAKASEYTVVIQGEEKVAAKTNRLMAWLMLAFFVLGLFGLYKCHVYLVDMLLPESASNHGDNYEFMLKWTLIVTGIVFFLTHIMLFYYIFKYQATDKRKALFYSHNNTVEVLWTTIPAIALLILVIIGLRNWSIMMDVAPKESLQVEITGKQFAWIIRYPGPDGVFGQTDFRLINDANNVVGLDWDDPASRDDIIFENGQMHLIKDHPAHLIIKSRDVIHDVGLPHFRMKMDAVPGIVTTMWFTPKFTSQEMIDKTGNPDFIYEIACDQMCGNGHYSMRGTIIVETQQKFDAWLAQQTSYYDQHYGEVEVAEEATEIEEEEVSIDEVAIVDNN